MRDGRENDEEEKKKESLILVKQKADRFWDKVYCDCLKKKINITALYVAMDNCNNADKEFYNIDIKLFKTGEDNG